MEAFQFTPGQRAIYESLPSPMGIYQLVDGKVRTLLVSDALCQMHGMPRQDLLETMNSSLYGFVHPDDVSKLAYFAHQELKMGNRFKYDLIFRVKEPHTPGYFVTHANGRFMTQPDGTRLFFVFYQRLDQEILHAEQNLSSYLLHYRDEYNRDKLTGLPSRNYVFNFAMEKVASLLADKLVPAAVLVNVSNMKSYNRQFGKQAGDQLLLWLASFLQELFSGELVARYQGDRFMIFADSQGIEQCLTKAHKEFARKTRGSAADLNFGIYQVQKCDTITDITDKANFALRHIGDDRRIFMWHYDGSEEEKDDSANYYLANFQRAMDEHWIKVYLQPIYDNQTGEICDYEALSRWQDPERGLIGPGQFIPVIEKHHLTFMLDQYMMTEVLRKLAQWKQNGVELHPVSVNLSHEDFDWPEIVEMITSLTDKYGIDHSLISIEITERDLAGDMTRLQEKMRELHRRGFKFWMDDFGSGYSSLNAMYEYRFDLIKLDMKFVQHLDENHGINRKLMKSLVQVAKEMGMQTLSEGVETEEEHDFVKQIGCSKTQGFLLAQLRPMDDYEKLL